MKKHETIVKQLPTINQKTMKNLSKINETSIPNRSKIRPKSIQNQSFWGSGHIFAYKRVLGVIRDDFWWIFEANMVPTWGPKSIKNRAKNNVKIDWKNDSIKNCFFFDFRWFSEEKWSQVGTKIGSKIDVNFERLISTKTYTNPWFFKAFWFPGVEVGS